MQQPSIVNWGPLEATFSSTSGSGFSAAGSLSLEPFVPSSTSAIVNNVVNKVWS